MSALLTCIVIYVHVVDLPFGLGQSHIWKELRCKSLVGVRNRNCLPLASTWIHPRFFCEVRSVDHLFRFSVFCFSSFCWSSFCVLCPNILPMSGLPIIDCPFGFLVFSDVYFLCFNIVKRCISTTMTLIKTKAIQMAEKGIGTDYYI